MLLALLSEQSHRLFLRCGDGNGVLPCVGWPSAMLAGSMPPTCSPLDKAAAHVFRFRLAVAFSSGVNRGGKRFQRSKLHYLLKFRRVVYDQFQQHAICMRSKFAPSIRPAI